VSGAAQLEYKQAWRGGRYWPFRRTAAVSNARSAVMPRRDLCLSCGHAGQADEVSSMNILCRGMEVLRDEGQDTAQACAGWQTAAGSP